MSRNAKLKRVEHVMEKLREHDEKIKKIDKKIEVIEAVIGYSAGQTAKDACNNRPITEKDVRKKAKELGIKKSIRSSN